MKGRKNLNADIESPFLYSGIISTLLKEFRESKLEAEEVPGGVAGLKK